MEGLLQCPSFLQHLYAEHVAASSFFFIAVVQVTGEGKVSPEPYLILPSRNSNGIRARPSTGLDSLIAQACANSQDQCTLHNQTSVGNAGIRDDEAVW